MNFTQIKRFEKKLIDYNNLSIMKAVNGKQFVRHLHTFYEHRKMNNFKDFELVANQWLQLFFNSKNKFSLVLWNTTLQKMYKISLQILLLDNDDRLAFSMGFLSILVDSRELDNIENFHQDLDNFIIILAKLYEHVFSIGVFHHQRLFFKIVYNMIQQISQEYKLQLVHKLFDTRLGEKILLIEKTQFEVNIRSIINRLNEKSDCFKSFAIVAKSIKIGDTIFIKSISNELWIDFNIVVMEISFYLNNNGNFELINIPISCIYDIIIVNVEETLINIVLCSNQLSLESGAHYTINGRNCVTITYPHGNNTNTLINYIIPEYLKWIHENTKLTTNKDSNKIIANSEVLAYETDSCSTVSEFNHSALVINDSHDLTDSALITNGVYETFKKSIIESESQIKNIVVQRVEPLQKSDATENDTELVRINATSIAAATVIPKSQSVLIRRLRYREVYSEVTQEMPVQSGSHVANRFQPLPNRGSQQVDAHLLVVQYDTRLEDIQERMKFESLNNWLNMTLQNTKRTRDDIKEQEGDTMDYELEPIFPTPSKNLRNRYFLRSSKTKPNKYVKQNLEKLNAEFGKELYNLVEVAANKFNNPRKISLENNIKLLKLKQRKILTNSLKEISEAINSIQEADEKIQKLKHKVTNKLDHQTRRIRMHKATLANRTTEIKELDSKTILIINQFKTNLFKTANPAAKKIWNNYVLNLSRHVQTNFLKKLF